GISWAAAARVAARATPPRQTPSRERTGTRRTSRTGAGWPRECTTAGRGRRESMRLALPTPAEMRGNTATSTLARVLKSARCFKAGGYSDHAQGGGLDDRTLENRTAP